MRNVVILSVVALLMGGCASVPMESVEKSNMAKKFDAPEDGKAGLYVYRHGSFGGALKKDVWLDGNCVGETAPDVFFYLPLSGDEEHKLSTESEFSPNDLVLKTESGKNYFVQQYIKMGVFVGGAGLKLVGEAEGKSKVSRLKLAKQGSCSK